MNQPILIFDELGPFGEPARWSFTLAETLAMVDAAQQLMRGALAGDEQAKNGIEAVFAAATNPYSAARGRAIVSAFILRAVLDSEQAKQPAPVQAPTADAPAPPAAPERKPCAEGHPPDMVCRVCFRPDIDQPFAAGSRAGAPVNPSPQPTG